MHNSEYEDLRFNRSWRNKTIEEIYPSKRQSGKECKEITIEGFEGKWLQGESTQSLHERRRQLAALKKTNQAITVNMNWSKKRDDAPDIMIS